MLFAEMTGEVGNGNGGTVDNKVTKVELAIAGYFANNRGTAFKKVSKNDELRIDFERLEKSVEDVLATCKIK